MPKRGDVAVCRHGYIGLITCDQPETERAGNDVGAEIWVGVQLTTKNGRQVGGPWQSRQPTVLGTMAEVLAYAGDYLPQLVNFLRASGLPSVAVLRNPPEPGNLFPRHPATKGFASSICTDGSRPNEGEEGYVAQPQEPPRYDIYHPRADFDPAPQIRNFSS